MQQYRYTFGLQPPAQDADVAARALHVVQNGSEQVFAIEPVDAETASVILDEDANVSVFLQDADDAGNVSGPSDVFQFTVTDTVPPPQPGIVVISAISPITSDGSSETVTPDGSSETV